MGMASPAGHRDTAAVPVLWWCRTMGATGRESRSPRGCRRRSAHAAMISYSAAVSRPGLLDVLGNHELPDACRSDAALIACT